MLKNFSPTSPFSFANLKALLAARKVPIVAFVTSPHSKDTVALKWGLVCVAGHCSPPKMPLSELTSLGPTSFESGSWGEIVIGCTFLMYLSWLSIQTPSFLSNSHPQNSSGLPSWCSVQCLNENCSFSHVIVSWYFLFATFPVMNMSSTCKPIIAVKVPSSSNNRKRHPSRGWTENPTDSNLRLATTYQAFGASAWP